MAAKSANPKDSKSAINPAYYTVPIIEAVENNGGIIDGALFQRACWELSEKLKNYVWIDEIDSIYPVPKNGAYVAIELSEFLRLRINLDPGAKSLIVDDLVDSGKTLSDKRYKNYHKAVLFHKSRLPKSVVSLGSVGNTWLKFPWEEENDIEKAVVRELEYIGEDASREGLIDTPKRVVRSWSKLYGGYKESPKEILSRKFESPGEMSYPVVLKDIEFFSTCEHHLLPFFGKVTIAYMPGRRIVGISKLARLVECFARRLQIQERMTEQIADAIELYLEPKGVYVHCEAQHFCMIARGVEKKNAKMVTKTVRGNTNWLKAHTLGDLS